MNYLLSCKMFCGYCGSMINAETGTGKLGKVYRYYKCGDKKRGKACELKPFPKDQLEDAIILATVNDMLTDDMIEKLTVRILEVQEQENAGPVAWSLVWLPWRKRRSSWCWRSSGQK